MLPSVLTLSCTKLVTVPPPKNSISTEQLFDSDIQADGALAGIYSFMINDENTNRTMNAALNVWGAGLVCLLGSMSGDDYYNADLTLSLDMYEHSTNNLRLQGRGYSNNLWTTAYKSIYGANSIVEGVGASTSLQLSATARKELAAEAKFVRALAYFYLVNFYGDVPLVLTVNFHETIAMKRTPSEEVYQQIIKDLNEAWLNLSADYSKGNGERVRPNKWAAAALLARAYLYTKDYNNAFRMANEVIRQQPLFELEMDLNKTFQANSREAIWQLKQTSQNTRLGNATPYGMQVFTSATHVAKFRLTDQLLNTFESNDKRKSAWIAQTNNSVGGVGIPPEISWFPAKYKVGSRNFTATSPKEYFMVLRLAEMYLVRAEAQAHGAGGGREAAIDDLNAIRHRAGLGALPEALDAAAVLAAIEKERQLELFGEWAHRWFDLKRTGRAAAVLSQIPMKSPWRGDAQLLYPIPEGEVRENSNLTQNEGYF